MRPEALLTRADPDEILTRRAPAGSTSFDPDTWTVEVVFSAGAPVDRFDLDGPYTEILNLDQRWPSTVPVLDSHNRGSVAAWLGKAERLVTVGGKAKATVTLSRHNPLAQRIAAELADGVSLPVSIGYSVLKWKETSRAGGRREKTATLWQLREISFVTLPADASAGTREFAPMPDPVVPASSQTPPVHQPAPPEPAATRAAPSNPPDAITNRASANTEIRSIARIAGLDQTWIDSQIDANADAETARRLAFEAMARRSAAPVQTTRVEIGTSHDDPSIRAARIGEALYARAHPDHALSEPAREFATLSTVDIARLCLRNAGHSVTALSPAILIERAAMTTSDFPLILGDATGRELRAAYQAAAPALRKAARKTTARDFRKKSLVRLSDAPTLEPVTESGEFTSGTMAEAKESYGVATYGRIIHLSRQILVNDDVGAFRDLSRPLGLAASVFEEAQIAKVLTSNAGVGPTMGDAKALFHDDHGNLAAIPGAPTIEALSAGRTAMRRQKGVSGDIISVNPRFVVVPPELETTVEQLLTAIAATKHADVNPLRSLEMIVDPRLTSPTAWYLAANPDEVDGLEYAHLEGAEGPQITTENGFEVDGVRIRVRLDFGCGFSDWRGWWRNAG